MKLSFVFLTLFFALMYSSNAQNKPSNLRPVRINFVGHIVDASTGRPLSGASVVLPDLRKGTVSDTAGIFKIPGINAGKYLVEISFTGYKSIIEPTDINNNGPQTFALAPSYLEAEAVTVTGVSAASAGDP